MRRRFATLDVFTATPLAGNPLAVVFDSDGLDTDRMQAIAREFALSETVFILPGTPAPGHLADIRIFTPGRELPFAGHPTVGTAVLMALGAGRPMSFVLGEKAGPVPCNVTLLDGRTGHATFTAPSLPRLIGPAPDRATLARILGLEVADIATADPRAGAPLEPTRYGAPVSFCQVPITSLEAMARIRVDEGLCWRAFAGLGEAHPALHVWCFDTQDKAARIHTRMFAPGMGIAEDPATGSAAAAFAGVIADIIRPGDGDHAFPIEQGIEMGRASLIDLTVSIRSGAVESIRIGGAAVRIADGTIDL